MNREVFFNAIRPTLYGGALEQHQVDGIEALLDYWQAHHPRGRITHLAYIFATAYHETATTMQPTPENGGHDYLMRMYDPTGDRPDVAKRLGNTKKGDGARYTGGLVQLTGRTNFRNQGIKHGIPLEAEPERILTMPVSLKVLVEGMLDGDFTGKALADYTDKSGNLDAIQARRVVNGRDQAGKVARYHALFLEALAAAESAPLPPDPEPDPEPPPPTICHPVPAMLSPVPVPPPATANTWLSGKKTHIGMLISGGVGIAAMLGYIPGISPATGAEMMQEAFVVSGFRSALPSLIHLGINLYMTHKRATP
jgi:hypothetical protein